MDSDGLRGIRNENLPVTNLKGFVSRSSSDIFAACAFYLGGE